MTASHKRTYAAAHFKLEIGDDKNSGAIKSVEGGGVRVDVMTYQNGGNYDRLRQIGKPKFDDIKLMMGMSTSKTYYSWIEKFFTGQPDRRHGAIVAADFYYKERARREFQEAMISEITFPGVDANSKDALYMAISLAVEHIAFKAGSGGKFQPEIDSKRQQIWKASDFSFTLGGFDTKHVTKIDPITIKQKIVEHHMGGHRAPTKSPSQVDFPNVVFYIPESHAQGIIHRFMKNGGHHKPENPARMTDGALSYLSSDRKVLGTLHFNNTEIVSVTPDKSEASSENIKNVKIELFCESMTWDYQAT